MGGNIYVNFLETNEVVLRCIYMGALERTVILSSPSSITLVFATNFVVVALEVFYLQYDNVCVVVTLCWVRLFLSILSMCCVSILFKFKFYFFDMDQEMPSCFIIFNCKELQ